MYYPLIFIAYGVNGIKAYNIAVKNELIVKEIYEKKDLILIRTERIYNKKLEIVQKIEKFKNLLYQIKNIEKVKNIEKIEKILEEVKITKFFDENINKNPIEMKNIKDSLERIGMIPPILLNRFNPIPEDMKKLNRDLKENIRLKDYFVTYLEKVDKYTEKIMQIIEKEEENFNKYINQIEIIVNELGKKDWDLYGENEKSSIYLSIYYTESIKKSLMEEI